MAKNPKILFGADSGQNIALEAGNSCFFHTILRGGNAGPTLGVELARGGKNRLTNKPHHHALPDQEIAMV